MDDEQLSDSTLLVEKLMWSHVWKSIASGALSAA